MLSPAVEDYLKAIYKLQAGLAQEEASAAVSTTSLARALDIAPASVTNMAKRLAEMGLVRHESYKGVTLTPAGTKVALEIIRHHRLLELYLKEVMDYSWEQLHEEAEHLEHHISEAFEAKIEEMLDYPTHDPHGHPIPTRDGRIADATADPLTSVEAGQTVTVRYVDDADTDLLHYLEDRGLMPGARVHVIEKAPFDGPLTIRVGTEEQIIGHEIARGLFVSSAED